MDALPYKNDPTQFARNVGSGTRLLTLGLKTLPEQAPTIEEARKRSIDLPCVRLETMDTATLLAMSESDRTAWYRAKLAPYLNQVNLSASRHRLPPELVGTIVLQELRDIGVDDLAQEALMVDGSIGIAQIQVKTAIDNGLVAQEGDQKWITDMAQVKYDGQLHDPGLPVVLKSLDAIRQETEWELTFHRLQVPQYAVEGVARELERLIGKMTKCGGNVWQRVAGFSLTSFDDIRSGDDLYLYVKGKTDDERACNLARLCGAAYASPGIIDAEQEESVTPGSGKFKYENGIDHGNKAWEVMRDLYALQPSQNGLLLYSGWVGRVMANGDVTLYSRATVPQDEYLPSYEGALLINGEGLVRVTVSARAFSKKALINNFLSDFYETPEDEITDEMIPTGPVTVRIFSEDLCRLSDGYSDATKDVYDDFLMEISEGGAVNWKDYSPLPANLMIAEGGGAVSVQLNGVAIAAQIAGVEAANPDAAVDKAVGIRVCWYLDATEQLGENVQMQIESMDQAFVLRINH